MTIEPTSPRRRAGAAPTDVDARLREHVDRLGEQHPPIELDSVDYTVQDAALLDARFGGVLDYMARVELEVDRNVLELLTLLPDPPEVDRHFYADVWQPQEIRHGIILDTLQTEIGRAPAVTDTDSVGVKLKVLGGLAHLGSFQDVCRMLYYLTGMSTERSAVLAYNALHSGLLDLGEDAVARTVVAPIRRQEPGHFAFYQLSARGLWAQLAPWQQWMVRRMRTISYGPVGVNNDEQHADFGEVVDALGLRDGIEEFAAEVTRVERELLWAREDGLPVPAYVVDAFRRAVELADERAA
ncbi:MAG: GTP-binding protein LepA [Nocardioides sp.]|nr:GTP-binding protein LepA [Nocardioides sp.]